MAAPAEVSKNRSNFRIRPFKEKRHFNIAANLTLNMVASFVILLIARTARIAFADRHTDTRDNYCNPLCTCAPRVNEQNSRDAAAKKRANTSGVGKINNYCEDIYIPPYSNTR